VPSEGEEVELRGVIESLGSRFYSGGWGHGTLVTEEGPTKITGTLEGHVPGTSVVVRGIYKDSKYGLSLACSSIIVDAVSGEMNVIRAWAKKYVREHEAQIVAAIRFKPAAQRWEMLANAAALEELDIETETAAAIAGKARQYIALVETKKGLMEKGFSDLEAELLITRYRDDVLVVLENDPWLVVCERILAFTRIDATVGADTPRVDEMRMAAAIVQSLVSAQRNGHTAVAPRAVLDDAAKIAGVFVDAVSRVGLPIRYVRLFAGFWQLASMAYAEADIAAWMSEAMRLEDG